jgi:hypothetical protein
MLGVVAVYLIIVGFYGLVDMTLEEFFAYLNVCSVFFCGMNPYLLLAMSTAVRERFRNTFCSKLHTATVSVES